VNYPVPFIPAGIVLQDFNGDGKLDVAVTGGDANSNHFIGVLPGKGDGTFGTAVTSSGGGGYFFLISADFNGDGKMDIAVQDGEILLGKGDGTFTPGPQPWNSGSNDFYTGMVAGDFNRDGKIDMAVVSSASDEVQIWLGNGDGTFALKSTYAAIFGGFNIGVSDLDGDGNIDLVIGTTGGGGFATDDNTAGDFQVLMGNGDGTFQAATVFPEFGTAQSGTGGVRSFAVGDLNGDGNQDLLGLGQTTSSQPALSTRFGNGKGSFTQGPVSAMQVTNEFALQTGDFNGDGKLDAVTLGTTSASDNTPSVHIYLGNGDGSFQPGVNYTLPATPSNMAVGDLNGDGKPDVVALTASGVYLLLNKGDGTLGTPKLVDGTPTTAAVAVIADLNGDGKADLVVLQDGNLYSTPPVPGNVLVYLGNGDGTFGAATTYLANTYSDGGLTIADVNGDGKLDILATTGTIGSGSTFVSNSVLNVLLGKGDGTFQSPITTAQLDEVPFLTVITVADFNQDGKLDVAQGDCCGLGDTYIFFGNGDGTFQTPVSLGVGVSSTSLTTANLKGDKYPDLMLANTGSYRYPDVVVLLNLYGANLMAQPVATATTLTASPTSATTGTAVTLTAVVKESPGSAIPTGSVTFLDGTATLGVGTLDATGTASFSTSLLTAGTHSLTANYGGDANNGGSASSEITVIITQPTPTFTFALNPATGTVSSGSTVATTATITPSGGFNQATTFACSGLPANATCSFSPATVTPSSGAVTTTLTIATGVQAAISPARSVPGRGTALAFLFGGLVAGLAGLGRGRRRRFTWLLVIAAAVIAGAISACGGGGGSGSGGGGGGTTTPSGTSTVTITATAGTLSKTATFTLTVQ
jgi:hypothetical protein